MDPIDDEKVKKFNENKRKDWQMINELYNKYVISKDVVHSLRGSTGDILKNRIAYIMQTAKKRKDVPKVNKKKNGTKRKKLSKAVPKKSLKDVVANVATPPKKKNQPVHTGTNTRISKKSGAVAHRNVVAQVTPPSNLGEIDKAVANQNVAEQVASPSNLDEIDKAVANQNVAEQVTPPSNLDEIDKAVANQNTLDSSQVENDVASKQSNGWRIGGLNKEEYEALRKKSEKACIDAIKINANAGSIKVNSLRDKTLNLLEV